MNNKLDYWTVQSRLFCWLANVFRNLNSKCFCKIFPGFAFSRNYWETRGHIFNWTIENSADKSSNFIDRCSNFIEKWWIPVDKPSNFIDCVVKSSLYVEKLSSFVDRTRKTEQRRKNLEFFDRRDEISKMWSKEISDQETGSVRLAIAQGGSQKTNRKLKKREKICQKFEAKNYFLDSLSESKRR